MPRNIPIKYMNAYKMLATDQCQPFPAEKRAGTLIGEDGFGASGNEEPLGGRTARESLALGV